MKLRKSNLSYSILMFCLIIAAAASSVVGQVGRASLTGVIRDQSGSVVASVCVTAVNTAAGLNYQTSANAEGVDELGAWAVGDYTITSQIAGFKEGVRGGGTRTAGQSARIDPIIRVGAVTEKVTVTADASLLQTESSQVS